ncbi:hypothetical protein L218DRAFT_1007342 [Marasmius fiardii PR-910]|nr:hypothetical protein L218DRAFT_1007342 [Marasmius fiardii PR-910]
MNASYLQEAESLWAPSDHEVFELAPPDFALLIEHMYVHVLGKPELTRENVWTVYMDLLDSLEQEPIVQNFHLNGYIDEDENYSLSERDKQITAYLEPELEALQPLLLDQDEYYMGGCNGGLGAEGDKMWDESVIDVYCDSSSDEENSNLYDAQGEDSNDGGDSEAEIAQQLAQYSGI